MNLGCPAEDEDPTQGDEGSTSEAEGSSGTTAGVSESTTGETTTSASTSGEATSTSGPQTGSEESGADESTTTGEPPPAMMPTDLPSPSGRCPTLMAGDVVFAPEGIPERSVRLWMSDAADELDGPVVFYWHGTGSNPNEATFGLGQGFIDAVVDAGGIVVAPSSDPQAGTFPWYLVLGEQEDDLILADEVLGCALESVGVDITRIHSAGMSAGGLQTSQMSYRRSNYLASVVTYSGGFLGSPPPDADPENPLAAMSFHGGPEDIVVVSFQDATERYVDALLGAGRFGFICDHGNGHTIPPEQNSVASFISAHPYGASPSIYEDGLPEGFPDYCFLGGSP